VLLVEVRLLFIHHDKSEWILWTADPSKFCAIAILVVVRRIKTLTMNRLSLIFVSLLGLIPLSAAFSVVPTQRSHVWRTSSTITVTRSLPLFMSSEGGTEKSRATKKGVQVMDRTETKAEEKKKNEEEWRVVLHNDEVHTFNYVVRSLCKVIGTLDRKAAFEICVQTHGVGKATITKTWKKQAEQFCLGLQRQGLTVSIAPDQDFEGGHAGGGL
jgi:ATP-dependent Clp protease adapter protein ClpS